MDGQSKLQTTAIVIGIIVIACMVICFALLFLHYSKQRRKVIDGGLADPEIDTELESIRTRVFKRLSRKKPEKPEPVPSLNDSANSRTSLALQSDDPLPVKLTYTEALTEDRRRRRSLSAIADAVYGIFVAILLILAGLGIASAATADGVTFIGDTALLVVVTSSMETADEDNTYLEENSLDDRIEQYSLISLERVTSTQEVSLYDVIAFTDSSGDVIVHRVIAINDDGTLRTRGDANTGSYSFELYVDDDQLIGVWTGWQSYGLGVTVTYLRSTLGIIALVGAGCFLIAYCSAEDYLERAYDRGLSRRAEIRDQEADEPEE